MNDLIDCFWLLVFMMQNKSLEVLSWSDSLTNWCSYNNCSCWLKLQVTRSIWRHCSLLAFFVDSKWVDTVLRRPRRRRWIQWWLLWCFVFRQGSCSCACCGNRTCSGKGDGQFGPANCFAVQQSGQQQEDPPQCCSLALHPQGAVTDYSECVITNQLSIFRNYYFG